MNDSIYVLVKLERHGADKNERYERVVYKFNTADLDHMFPVRGGDRYWGRLTITDRRKVLVLVRLGENCVVDVYESDGQFVRSFGEGLLNFARDITAANDGRVMVLDGDDSCVHIFSEDGDHLNKIKLQGCYSHPIIAFHRASEHVVVAGVEREKDLLHVEICNKDDEFARSTQIHEENVGVLLGMTVTTDGRIAIESTSLRGLIMKCRVLVI